ncbi:hypothetical protein SAMN05216359_12165, partial [Roseateles sp. YR242]
MNKFSSKMIKRVAVGLGLVAAAVGSSVTANATTGSTTFQVTATVITSCNVSGAALNFGNTVDPLNT